MKNTSNQIKNQIAESVSTNVVEYFAGMLSPSAFIEKYIQPITSITDDQEDEICETLKQYDQEWYAAPCNPEGANKEQDINLDRIIDQCAKEIAMIVLNLN